MPRIFSLLSALMLLAAPALADGEVSEPELLIVDAGAVTLEEFLWIARPLVVFADAPADPRFAEQLELIAEDAKALVDRDVVVITDTDPRGKSATRTRLRPRGFMLALLDKDGTVVFRKPRPRDVREIGRAIDKLPSRKQELVRQRALAN